MELDSREIFNNLARKFVKSFNNGEEKIYKSEVIDKYSPEEMQKICSYILKDKNQKRFPLPVDFDRAAMEVIKIPPKKEDYGNYSPEHIDRFFNFFKEECLKPLIKSYTEKNERQIDHELSDKQFEVKK